MQNGRYVYAVIPASAVDSLKLETSGIDGAEVYPVVAGEVAALVSDADEDALRPDRKHLATHTEVLREVMNQTSMLPVAFGIVAGDERALRNLLAEHEADFSEELRNVTDQVELGLRGRLKVPNLFEYFVEAFPELRTMRDNLFQQGAEPSREQKIELGKSFAELLDRFRDEIVTSVRGSLEPVATGLRFLDPRTDDEVLNMAVLVPRDRVGEITRELEVLAPKLDQRLQLDLTGPWPPYNFVSLRVHLEEEAAAPEQEAR